MPLAPKCALRPSTVHELGPCVRLESRYAPPLRVHAASETSGRDAKRPIFPGTWRGSREKEKERGKEKKNLMLAPLEPYAHVIPARPLNSHEVLTHWGGGAQAE